MRVVIFLRGSDPPKSANVLDNKGLYKILEDGKHDVHITVSQNVKISGQMDLILDKWSIPGQSSPGWLAGMQ